MWHTPVMIKEVIELLQPVSGGTYIDATLGGGGWAEAILGANGPDGRLIGFDRDDDALGEASKRLKKFGSRAVFVKAKFSEITKELRKMKIDSVDGAVADLGVSSHQLDDGERGFSFAKDAPLDMRMDKEDAVSAHDLVNGSREEELANLIYKYGEERFSRRIARRIIEARKVSQISTTLELAEIVRKAVPGGFRKSRIDPATRTFQALRIAVNCELEELENLVETVPEILKSGGRFVVVSYHSLEDRIVKHAFLAKAQGEGFERVTKKPLRPSETEIEENRRGRSARLRVLQRV